MAKKVVRKAAPKKVAAKKTAPAKKTAVKKAVAKKAAPAKKAVKATKKTGAGVAGQNLPRDYDDNGFVKGSNSALIAEMLIEGGETRVEVTERIKKALSKTSTANLERSAPSMVTNVLRKLEEQGYTVEASWKLVAGNKPAKKKAAPAAKKAAKKAPAKKAVKKVARKKA